MTLAPDRLFDPDPTHKKIALELYEQIKGLPIISPHGHVDPLLFSDPARNFGNPVELIIQPDHYVLRMLYSQGIPYDLLLSQDDPRQTWQLFAENFYLFRGTPSGLWLTTIFEEIFGVTEKLDHDSASKIYDQIESALSSPEFSPRALFEKLNIEVLATTDAVTDTLQQHRILRESGWSGRIIPTFRPDGVTNLDVPGWRKNIDILSEVSGITIRNYQTYITALEQRRSYFHLMGATAMDISPAVPDSSPLEVEVAEAIFQRALHDQASVVDAARFSANMLFEMARMSVEDGMVMQIHTGVYRNHNQQVFSKYGADRGFDIPIGVDFTRGLFPLLEQFGNNPKFNLILFTLDEATYGRELAPIAGAYQSVKIGPPWWFHDSWNGMRRYFDLVMETAGIYNTAGFNDDTRAFLSIPARHDVWRRASANWLAGLLARKIIDRHDAESMAVDLAIGLVKKAYQL
jgi:glucuronate isomerase